MTVLRGGDRGLGWSDGCGKEKSEESRQGAGCGLDWKELEDVMAYSMY